MIQDRFLNRVLQEQTELSRIDLRQQVLVISANYELKLVGDVILHGRKCIQLELSPKKRSPYVLDGTIWIDAQIYVPVRVMGRLSASPSFWAGRPTIQRDYMNLEGFAVPTESRAESRSFLFGKTLVTIEYTDYRLTR